MNKVIFMLLALLVVACATPAPSVKQPGRTSETLNKDGTKSTVTESDMAVHNKLVEDVVSRPLVKITCPPQGCVMLSFEVAQPLQGQLKDLLYQPQQEVPQMSPFAQGAREIMQPLEHIVLGVSTGAFLYKGATSIIGSLADMSTNMARQIQAPPGTSIAVIGSSGVGVQGGTGSTQDRHDTTDRHDTVDNSDRSQLQLLCNFYQQSSAPGASIPAYCTTGR